MLSFLAEQYPKILEQTATHIGLTLLSLLLALLAGVPLGIGIARRPPLSGPVLGVVGVLQTVPSIALLGFLIPVLGIGVVPALVALFLYGLLPIVRNTFVGITEVSPTIREAARSLGMTNRQILWNVELPLALPVLFAGIRTAAVINVGVATLAAYVAAGGLGEFIFGGIALSNVNMMLAGAIPAALLAVGFDTGLAALQRLMKPGTNPKNRQTGVVAGLIAVPFLLGFSFWPGQQDKLIAGFAHEFYGRADGYLGLRQTYGLNLRPRLIDQSLMYEAIHNEQVDIISGYSTDGRIRVFDLLVLTDDRHAFPPYDAAPVIRQTTLNRHPELGPTLDLLAGKLTDAVMTDLNYRADYLHQSPERIARDLLTKTRLLRASPTAPRLQGSTNEQPETIVLGSKVFTEQYILSEIYRQLIESHTRLRVITKTGLGGTQICFDALRTGAIDLYPEYTGTGLLVILQPPADSLKTLPMQAGPVFDFVSRAFQKKYGLHWGKPLGFSNSYCLMMRRKQAESVGISRISGLVGYLGE